MPLQITFQPNELQTYLRVDPGVDDVVIDGMRQAVTLLAEQFLNTDFSTATTVITEQDGTIRSVNTAYIAAVTVGTVTSVLNNDDLSTTTTTTAPPTEAPTPVKLWVMDRVAQLYENRGQAAAPDYTLIQQYRIYSFRG